MVDIPAHGRANNDLAPGLLLEEGLQMGRRAVFAGLVCLVAGCTGRDLVRQGQGPIVVDPYVDEAFPIRRVDRSKYAPEYRPQRVAKVTGEDSGTVIVDTRARQLFLVQDSQTALRYGVAVGAAGHSWKGTAYVGRKEKWPAWFPTDDMHSRTPGLPRRIEPGPANPLGARALYLFDARGDTLYRIHGTSEPWTIGTEASSGCIRLVNEDVIELFERVAIHAKVVVI